MTGLLMAAVLAVYLYVSLEWLFFVTKPSFMETLPWLERFRVLLIAPLPPLALVVGMSALLWLTRRLVPGRVIVTLGRGVPAAILACCAFILIDNFTYTVLGFGVVSTAGVARFAYLGLLLALFASLYRAVAPAPAPARATAGLVSALVVVSLIGVVWQLAVTAPPPAAASHGVSPTRALPNVIIVGADGVNAAHVSAYGYQRPTTPFLTHLMEGALVIENAFPNANSSAGSLGALLTGKLPLRTRLLQHPDILTGVNAYQHLPGILKRLGYRSIHMSTRLYTDPFQANMQHAFDVSNFRERKGALHLPALPGRLALAYAPALYFVGELYGRLAERVLHASGIRAMANPLAELETGRGVSDESRVDAVLDFLDRAAGPVFAHLHLMGTHRPFRPRKPVFSAGPRPEERWRGSIDLYDDVITDFDRDVARIVEHLDRTGKRARTVLVVTSDHGWGWTYTRLPLMFVFPGGEPRGRISANAQLIDVAPTLLDYLGVPVPAWMDGASLIGTNIDPMRPIVTLKLGGEVSGPFPRVGALGVMICDRVFWLDPHLGQLSDATVQGHTRPCDASQQGGAARAMLVDQLRVNGFDVSSLERGQPAR